jgi:protein associated with RNAse G/E
MPEEQITVNSRKFDGTIKRSWKCELIERSGDMLTFVGVFDRDVEHEDLGFIRNGTVSYEFYGLNNWFNVFRFHEPDGTFRNFYCNINMPPTFAGGVLDYVDLDIDVVVWPDSRYEILDREDFERNARRFAYPQDLIDSVETTLAELITSIENREFPFGKLASSGSD